MKRYFNKFVLIIIAMIMILTSFAFTLNSNATTTYTQTTIDATSSNNNGIASFPASYQTLLNKLVSNTGHTNWKFKALYTDIDWNTLVENETDDLHNTIYKGYPSSWYCSCGKQGDSGYYCASKDITSYYMDPRNFLTEITIFQFLDLSNSSSISVEDIQSAVAGTYLAGSANGESYAQMIYDASVASGESALSIVVRIFQELGTGQDLPYMISGTDSTYPGVYNFYNYGATDGDGALSRGLAYAKNAGWTTPQKALIEGAKLVASNYTNAGQVNKYLYKFDVVGTSSSNLFHHQYMTNVEDPNSQANILYGTYSDNNLTDDSLTFVIPVYKNMPAYVKLPNSETGDLYYISSNYTSVNFRSEASSNSSVICQLRKDTVVSMIQPNVNGFGKISVNGTVGYMSMSFLSKVNTSQDVYSVPGVETGEKYLGSDLNTSSSNISYSAQIQDIGWSNWAKDGETIGTIGQSRRLETIKIKLGDSISGNGLTYRTHVQDIGWMNWVNEGEQSGTVNQSKRIEAIQIKLADSSNYNVFYRVYVQDIGWMDWVSNGEIAGTTGQGKRIEAIQIKTEKKTQTTAITASGVSYISHAQDYGWLNWMSNGDLSGTTGKSKRVEAIKIKLDGLSTSLTDAIQYRVHVQDIGWMNWVSDGALAGTTGESKRIEAIQIKLNSSLNKTVKYRVHVQDIGWMDWVANGQTAGTTGQAKRIEAIEIKIE